VLISAMASKDQEMTAQAAGFKVAEEKLLREAATSFAEGFAEALSKLPAQILVLTFLVAALLAKWSMAK